MDGQRAQRRWAVAAWGVAVLVLAVLTLVPSFDLHASAMFYVAGHGFPWRTNVIGQFVREVLPRLIVASAVVCVGVWIAGRVRHRVLWGLNDRKIAYLLTSLLIGPGLIVETFLKPHSGRARPDDLTMFGGNAGYTSPLAPAHACLSNCSFVSGHAAVAFWVTAYAFLVPPAWRIRVFVGAVIFGLLVGAVRVMQGAHFVSDVAYAGAIVVLVNVVLARVLRLSPPGAIHVRPAA
jgi:lipid A 4'-phosphatase